MKYANEFILNMGLDHPTTCVYQLFYNETYINYTKIIQYFIMHRLVLCVKLYSFEAHMIHACSFSNNESVPIYIHHSKYILSLNTFTTVLAWGAGNPKNRT